MPATHKRHTDRFVSVLITVVLLGASCTRSASNSAESLAPGVARLLVTCGTASACAPIARVTVTVTRGDGPDFPDIVQDLVRSGDQWTGRVNDVPAGAGRRFAVVALDKDAKLLFQGEGRSDIEPGAAAVVSVFLNGTEPPGPVMSFPVIDSLTMSRTLVAPGRSAKVSVNAHDAGGPGPLTYWWRSSCGSFDDAGTASPTWTAPGAEGTCQLSISVANARGATVTASLSITVTTQVGDITILAVVNSSPIVSSLTGRISLGATLEGDLVAVAADPDGDPLAYGWSSSCPGLTFDFHIPYGNATPHLSMPGPTVACNVTLTVTDGPLRGGRTTASIQLPPNGSLDGKCNGVTCQTGQVCDPSDGTCKGTTNLCGGVTCTPLDPCHEAGACEPATGQCLAGAAKVCAAGLACDLADGVCKAPAGLCTGVTCTPSDLCHDPGACLPATGQCSSGAAKVCPSGQACDLADGACKAGPGVLLPRPQVARGIELINLQGLAVGIDGSSYVTGSLGLPTKIFDAFTLTSAGGSDTFVARYGPDGIAVWAVNLGDALDQQPSGIAVTADGTVASVGQFTGVLTPSAANPLNTPVDYLLGLSATDGSVRFARSFNNGVSGVLQAIAANPTLNRIAVCGYTDRAATDLVPGATFGGGRQDIVIAVFDSSGTRLWSRQIGGGNEEDCAALAIDDAGDVYAAGRYDGVLSIAGSPLPNPGSSFRRWIWVARFAGSSGNPLADASFGSGNGNHRPWSMTVDAAGKLVLSGSLSNTLNFGPTSATLLTSAGATDGFVAKLDPGTTPPFGHLWSTRIGGAAADEARGVAVDASGDVIAVGLMNGTTTGAATLTSSNPTYPSAFVIKLTGAGGSTQYPAPGGAVYGNATGSVNASKLAINRHGTGPVKDLVVFGGDFAGSLDFGPPTVPLDAAIQEEFLVFAKLLP